MVTNTLEDMITLLNIVELLSNWSGIRLNVGRCKITAYLQGLQSTRKKKDRNDALRARLARVSLGEKIKKSLTRWHVKDIGSAGGYTVL